MTALAESISFERRTNSWATSRIRCNILSNLAFISKASSATVLILFLRMRIWRDISSARRTTGISGGEAPPSLDSSDELPGENISSQSEHDDKQGLFFTGGVVSGSSSFICDNVWAVTFMLLLRAVTFVRAIEMCRLCFSRKKFRAATKIYFKFAIYFLKYYWSNTQKSKIWLGST